MDAFILGLAGDELRRVKCQPMPARWAAFAARRRLAWTHIDFDAARVGDVPADPGFYCFFVGLPPACLPPVGYPMYVGKTERTLRARFGEYLRERHRDGGRVRVRKFLTVFERELYFSCAPFRGSADEVRAIETELHDALMPSYGDLGYSAEVRAGGRAWQ